jgi:carbamoyl-phosphate synthase large subunit
MTTRINVGVTGIGSLIGQAIIKSIQRSDLVDRINIIGFDYFMDTVGSFWINENYILPDLLKSDVTHEEWLNVLVKVLKARDVKLLFVGVDFELPVLAKHKEIIEKETGAIVMVSSPEVVDIADDKFLTFQFLKSNNLLHPQTFLPGKIDYSTLDYPVIIKPRKGARSIGVHKVVDKDNLLSVLTNVKEPVIQECVGSDEEEFTCGTIYLNDVTEKLKPFGACNFQLRLDANGNPKIFEINSRHSGTTYIRSLFGYKEIEYIIKLILFDVEIEFDLKEGTVVRYYEEFFTEK